MYSYLSYHNSKLMIAEIKDNLYSKYHDIDALATQGVRASVVMVSI